MTAQRKTAEPTVVNGINVDDLFALIEGVRREPAKGKTHWHVATTWQGQARSRAQVESFEIGGERVPRRFSIDIDEPRELSGSNSFANPQEHLLAALNVVRMLDRNSKGVFVLPALHAHSNCSGPPIEP